MKKQTLYLISALFAASTLQAQTTDLTKGLSIWFDKPCSLSGMASFYNYSADRDWEERSLPIGNGSFGGNIFGSVAAERILQKVLTIIGISTRNRLISYPKSVRHSWTTT